MKTNTITLITKGIAIVALFTLALFPLFVADGGLYNTLPNMFFPFIVGKALYVRTLIEIAFAAWVVLCFLDAKYRPKMSPLTIAVSAFALVTLIADLIGVNPLRSLWSNFERMEGWITIVHMWALYMAATHTFGFGEEGKRWWRMWFNASVVVAFFVACYGLAQHYGWYFDRIDRAQSSLGNAEYLAVYLLWNIGWSVYMCGYLHSRKIYNAGFYWIYGIMAAFLALVLVETGTRGTTFGLIGGVIVGLALYTIFARPAKNTMRYVTGGTIVAIFLFMGIIYAFKDSSFISNNSNLSRLTHISVQDLLSQDRAYLWPMAIKGWAQSPHTIVAGWGQENYNYIFNANYNVKMWGHEQWFDRAHSVYLDWLVSSGALGLIAYLSLYVFFIVLVWKSDLTVAKKSILTGLLVGYSIHNLVVFDNIASYVMFFVALGFVGSLHEYKPVKWFGSSAASVDAAEYVVAPIAIVLLVGCIWFFDVRIYQTNTSLIQALNSCSNTANPTVDQFQAVFDHHMYVANQESREQLLQCAGTVVSSGNYSGPTRQAFLVLATDAINNQIAATPNDSRIYTLGGSFYTQIGQYSKAIDLFKTALKLSPNKQSTMEQLGLAYVLSNQLDAGLNVIQTAYQLDTDNTRVKSQYVTYLVYADKEDQAHKLFGDDPTLFQTQQIARIYMSKKQYDKGIAIYQALAAQNPTDANSAAAVAQAQFTAGRISAAIKTMQAIGKDHPELIDDVNKAVQQMQKQL